MEIREVICKRWILREWIKGITLYPFIFYNGEPTDTLKRHEWIHVDQIRKHGVFKFYVLYLYYSFRYGYEKNPFETEAYKKQDEQKP